MKKPPLINSFKNAIKGIWITLKNERNFKIHTAALIFNIILILLLQLNLVDTILIILVCCNVMVTEMINTAIEKICDYIQPNYDHRIGIIKDIAAGAVFLFAILAIVVAAFIYPKYLF